MIKKEMQIRIRAILFEKDLKQKDVVEKINISQAALSRILRGKESPPSRVRVYFAELLNIKEEDLVE